jgi:hypothetical protein
MLLGKHLGIHEVLMGHEKSADYGNGVTWNGEEVNHQYDKSCDFLKRAEEYSNTYFNSSCKIKSALSNLYEIEISRIFCETTELKKFHRLFLSCNEAVDLTKW